MTQIVCDEGGVRLDVLIARNVARISRQRSQSLISEGRVKVNGASVSKSYKTAVGDLVEIDEPPPAPLNVPAQDIKLSVLYEDEHIVVVDKPAGMVVHPSHGHHEGTLVNALMYHCEGALSDINGVVRPGIVHRLDKDTSGIVVVAKTNDAHRKLAAAFKMREVKKIYLAIVVGHMRCDAGHVELDIGRSKDDRKKMAPYPVGEARSAKSDFRVLRRLDLRRGVGAAVKLSALEVEILTGRTHQIRVHLAAVGHPVLGDRTYGGGISCPFGSAADGGHMLHALSLAFVHPATGERVRFQSPLPERFTPYV